MDDKVLKEFRLLVSQLIASNKCVIASNLVSPYMGLCKKGNSPEKAWGTILEAYREVQSFMDRESKL